MEASTSQDGLRLRASQSQSESSKLTSDPNETPKTDPEGSSDKQKEEGQNSFECNICLDQAKYSVVSTCGHLFCWPCIHQWLETRGTRSVCPVCKSAISKEKLVPIYGRGDDWTKDPRQKIPPRPQGQRSEHDSSSNWTTGFGTFFGGTDLGAQDGGGFRMSVGIGAFPIGLFTTVFSIGNGAGVNPWTWFSGANDTDRGEAQPNVDAEWMAKLCFIVVLLFVALLIFA